MDKAGLCKATIASFGAAVLLTAGLATTAFADEKTAAEDACKAEHILSEQTLEKIRERAIETDAELGKTVK